MTDRRKPTAAFWIAAALVVLPLLYVASFGPACWMTARAHDPVKSPPPPQGMVIYWPLGSVIHRGWPGRTTLTWWATLCVRRGNIAVFPMEFGGSGWIERGP